MARVICRVCGGRTEEGGFCEKCGTALADDNMSYEANKSYAHCDVDATAQDAADFEPTITSVPQAAEARRDSVPDMGARLLEKLFAGTDAACDRNLSEGDDADDCPSLRVERDMVAFCVAGTNGLLRLRVTALAEGVQDLSIRMHMPCAAGAAIPSVGLYRPKAGKPAEFSLAIPPLAEGAYPAELDLKFELAGVRESYAANVELYVYPSDSSAKQIAESIVFNINNDIKTGHASDVRQSFDAASMLGRFSNNGNSHGLSELLDLLKTGTRSFRRVYLNETASIGLRHPPEEALADRLTLDVGGKLLHLIAGARVTFGRHRANRVVTRIFDPGKPVMAPSSLRISKHHCTVEMDGETCVIRDGAADASGVFKQSGGGVFWNGSAVDGSVRIPVDLLPRQAVLGFAGQVSDPCFSFSVSACRPDSARCARCEDRDTLLCRRGRVPALALRRADHVPETFVLFWSCLDLGRVAPELQGLTVCHERGGFSWRSSSEAGWLKPGRYQVVGTEIRVMSFQQYGL